MKEFTKFFINRSLMEMNDVNQIKSQMSAKASEMADSLQKLYPNLADQIRNLIPQFDSGKIDYQQFTAQLQQITGMIKQVGPAFGGNQPKTTQLQPQKKPMLGPAFGGQPQQKKPLLGPAFGG